MSNVILHSESFERAAFNLARTMENFSTGGFEQAVREFSQAVEKQSRIAAMQSMNELCKFRGDPPHYTETDFFNA